jgi:hypothetical protein
VFAVGTEIESGDLGRLGPVNGCTPSAPKKPPLTQIARAFLSSWPQDSTVFFPNLCFIASGVVGNFCSGMTLPASSKKH